VLWGQEASSWREIVVGFLRAPTSFQTHIEWNSIQSIDGVGGVENHSHGVIITSNLGQD